MPCGGWALGAHVSDTVRQLIGNHGARFLPAATDAMPRLPPPIGHGTIAVVIPCYRVRDQILSVIAAMPPEIAIIYAIDDACPEGSGEWLADHAVDPRLRILWHATNQGVGGAVITGLRQALADGADIVVKLDGDGQMDAGKIALLVQPIQDGTADYTKGNRFYDPGDLAAMPRVRLFGNAVLSFLAKLSTGYWQCFDPTNGFVAIQADVARRVPWQRLHRRYFFETDLLFRLNTLRARVVDVPMPAIYGDEQSSLRILRSIPTFLGGHLRNIVKRIGYNYFLRDFSLASLELVIGFALLLFGTVYGLLHWGSGAAAASAGVVMLSALPVILGLQFLLAFLAFDIQSAPTAPIHPLLARRRDTAHPSPGNEREGLLAP